MYIHRTIAAMQRSSSLLNIYTRSYLNKLTRNFKLTSIRSQHFHHYRQAMAPFSFKGIFGLTSSPPAESSSKKRKLSGNEEETAELPSASAALNPVKKSATEIMKSATNENFKPHPIDKYNALKPIIWIDCEMTGLNHNTDHIIEICCLITDKDLNLLDPIGYESVIHYPESRLQQMDEWCTEHHGSSGLSEKVINSDKTLQQVEDELLEYISKFVTKNVGIIAGNTIHMDRLFMIREMPKVIDYLMYRIIDVSSIMEFAKRHNPKIHSLLPPKVGSHTAKSDILDSIAQMKFYRDVYFKDADEVDEVQVKKIYSDEKDIHGSIIQQGDANKDYRAEN